MSRGYSSSAAASFGFDRDDSGDFVEVALSRGMVTLVDRQDVHLLGDRKWQAKPSGPHGKTHYAVIAVGPRRARRQMWLHRLIAGAADGEFVDHINGNGLDNRRANLRLCSHAENCANRGYPVGNSRKRCVRAQSGHFQARISPGVGLQPRVIGTFATADEAARAYDVAAMARFGAFARLNFPAGAR
ncbi:HNH endonuclease [Bosea sp. BK604]|uniref:HNH endonuclease n=1 Tax=Bosea sp. BK604 TaxID=2512180 RepID=UPI001046F9C1|nr:HNH endonuclease [Bosea sp. BK604]